MRHFCSDCQPQAFDLFGLQAQKKQRQLTTAIGLIGGFALTEALIGWSSHSLALVAEAGHLVADCAALGLALWATFVSRSSSKMGWIGTHQLTLQKPQSAETWAAFANGFGLVLIALWITWEAAHHLQQPSAEIESLPMLMTAIAGVVVNSINVALLHKDSQHDLNLKGAFLHVLADMLGSIGVIVAAIAVAVLHWLWADCAISFVIAGLISLSAIPLIWQSGRQLWLQNQPAQVIK